MSEYWVSKKKYFCKYCDIYITDDAPSRKQHETGLRHQGNRDRFIRGLYKEGERRKRDAEEEKREMARIESAAHAAFSKDLGSGRATGSGQSLTAPTPAPAPRKPPPKPSNPYTNYTTAAQLGYKDPDFELVQARSSQGTVGEWQVVETSSQPQSGPSDAQKDGDEVPTTLKREAEIPVDETDPRQFKLRKRTLATGLGQIYDPGTIPIKIKKKEEEQADPLAAFKPSLPPPPSSSTVEEGSKATEKPKWVKVQWRKPGEQTEDTETAQGVAAGAADDAPSEDVPPPIKHDPEPQVESEPQIKFEPSIDDTLPPAPSAPVFKKRKMPSTSAKGKREI